jgi:hypothetical protein
LNALDGKAQHYASAAGRRPPEVPKIRLVSMLATSSNRPAPGPARLAAGQEKLLAVQRLPKRQHLFSRIGERTAPVSHAGIAFSTRVE